MSSKLETLNKEFDEGCRLKDIARKDINHLEVFVDAATHMKTASDLSLEIASDSSASDDIRFEAKTCGLYYLSEHHSCLGSYYYELRDATRSKSHQQESLNALTEAIDLIENVPQSISTQTTRVLKDRLPTWRYIQKVDKAHVLASDARAAWDSSEFIDALDLYREGSRIQREAISMAERENLPLSYRRIAAGNYIGMMANASNALTQIILQKGTIGFRGTTKVISSDAALDLLRYALDTYRLSNSAFDENPEWNQYRALGANSVRNIQNFLIDNKASWLEFYLALEDDPDFLRIMKMTDLQKYKAVEIERHFQENKIAKLWLAGSFWILAASILTALVMYVTKAGLSWWQLILALSTIETVLLVIIASTLRSLGDLSEEGFLKLIGVALKYQLKVIRQSKKQDNRQQGNGT